jgi:prepilin-type N-terminal cleavage/methylation domain-containing protein
MTRQLNKNKGFSLVELLIAIAILSIIMVMVSAFMTSTLKASTKTKLDMRLQSEAQQIYYQMSDILMQATYIRVTTKDGAFYQYDSSGDEFTEVTTTGTQKDFVPDNYCNYQANTGTDSKKVIVDFNSFMLMSEDGTKTYPDAKESGGSAIDIDSDDTLKNDPLQSFRVFSMAEGTPLYIVPEYIYIEYSTKGTESTTETGGKVTGTSVKKGCVLFKYDGTEKKIYMFRSSDTDDVPTTMHFSTARKMLENNITSSTSDFSTNNIIADNVKNFYFSADSDANSIDIALDFENNKSKGHRYHLKQTINFRNSNVLSVKPQLLLKKKGTGTASHLVGSSGSGGSSSSVSSLVTVSLEKPAKSSGDSDDDSGTKGTDNNSPTEGN